MELRDPQALARVRRLFAEAPFLRHIELELTDVGPGWAESRLAIRPYHTQNQGFVHAGVQGAVGDHTAGAAAGTLVAADQAVVAVEFKVNLLRPGLGETLRCRAEVVKAGRQLVVAEARLWTGAEGRDERLVATFMSTIAIVAAG